MYTVLFLSWLMYITMFALLRFEYDIFESEFFYVHVDSSNTTKNPVLLGIPVRNEWQRTGLCIFFAANAFLGIINSCNIDGLWGTMLYGVEKDKIVDRVREEFGGLAGMLLLFTVYDVWKSARIFFSILGMYSNVVFFMCTTIGALLGGLLMKTLLFCHIHGNGITISLLRDNASKRNPIEDDCEPLIIPTKRRTRRQASALSTPNIIVWGN